MTAMPDFVAELRDRAHAAQAEEIRFRRSIAAEMEARERARAWAFRRLGLIRAMVTVAVGAETAEEARAAQQRAFAVELGFDGSGEAQARTVEAWGAVADAVHSALRPAAQEGPPAPTPAEALAAFEAWYEAAFGRPFLALLDQEPLEIPVVEG